MLIGKNEDAVDVKKSTGRLVTLMYGTKLPLMRYEHGKTVLFTIEPLGPAPHGIYDWARSSPVTFAQRTVDNAFEEGFLQKELNGSYVLAPKGQQIAPMCHEVWGAFITEHFVGRGVDWHDLGGSKVKSTILVCQSCGIEIVLTNPNVAGGNVGSIMKQSGWEVIIHLDMSTGWWCRDCTRYAVPHIEALLGLLGDDFGRPRAKHAYWNSLVHIVQRRREDVKTEVTAARSEIEAERAQLFRKVLEHDLSRLPVSVLSKILETIEQDTWAAELAEKSRSQR
jgi:hypothetical protein